MEAWDTPEAAQEYLSRGRGLQRRLQRELGEPVEFFRCWVEGGAGAP